MIRFCKIPIIELNQSIFDVVINDSMNSCIVNNIEDIAVVCWDGDKPSELDDFEEISQEDLFILISIKDNGWGAPFEVSLTEAAQLPEDILLFLKYSEEDIVVLKQ